MGIVLSYMEEREREREREKEKERENNSSSELESDSYSKPLMTKLEEQLKEKDKKILELTEMVNLLQCHHHSKETIPLDQHNIELIKEIKAKKQYEYLVFSGGGIKGISYCGALDILEQQGILSNIKGYAGTSAGSIVASLLAIGYTSAEIKELLNEIDFNKMVGDIWDLPFEAVNLLEKFGTSSGKYFYDFLGDKIKAKTGNPDYTFEDLYKDTKKQLVIVGTDMTHRISLYFYHKKSIPIRHAIRISMSVPLVFQPSIYENNICVDGGILDNYPLHVFDGNYPGEQLSRLNLCPPNPKVLGLRIITQDESYVFPQKYPIDNIFDYILSFGDVLMSNNEKMVMTPSYWYRTINILTTSYPLYHFTLSTKQKNELINAGTDAVEKFFK